MIIRQATTVFFNPVAEYKERHDFEKDNPDFRKILESTTTVAYEKVEYFRMNCCGEMTDEVEDEQVHRCGRVCKRP